jgi:AcrR family transcriptional regulator
VSSKASTRERVLDRALTLFNDHGVELVTTNAIANATAINEGNLYYYFKTKEALAIALFDRFEAEALGLLAGEMPTDVKDPRAYTEILVQWFLLTWSYRFLFRDIMFLQKTAPLLTARLRAATPHMERATRSLFEAMQVAGLIDVPVDAWDSLQANLWIVSSYWISYLMLHDDIRTLGPEHLDWGLNQVRSLYFPYLTEAARAGVAPESRRVRASDLERHARRTARCRAEVDPGD